MAKYILLFILLFPLSSLSAQLEVFAVDTTNYPTMSAKFYILDEEGKQIKDFSHQDFTVTENGITRNIIDITCPPDPTPTPYSLAISIDVSGSMNHNEEILTGGELAKITATELCRRINMPPSEMALQICNDVPLIVSDFTYKKQKLLYGIENAIVFGGNDFEAHLMDTLTGLLPLAQLGENKKMAILLTDAYYQAMTPDFLQKCIDYCNQNNIIFHSVIYSNPSANNKGIKSSLAQLCNATGGLFLDGINTRDAAQIINNYIRELEPCQIQWQSDYLCRNDVQDLSIQIPKYGLGFNYQYYQSHRAIAKLKLTPSAVYFENKPVGIQADTTITITAMGHSFNISNIECDHPAFTVDPKSFSLMPGESQQLNISFTPTEEKGYIAELTFENNKCPISAHLVAGYSSNPISPLKLKLTHPNGGEDFLVGSDTLIKWEGSLPDDKIKLEYSSNSGANWQLLTDEASGSEYLWKDIPLPASTQCLIRASKGKKIPPDINIEVEWDKCLGEKYDDFANCIIKSQYGGYISAGAAMIQTVVAGVPSFSYDLSIYKITESGILEWQKKYGGGNSERCNSIVETADGGYLLAGVTGSNDKHVSGNHGGDDIWLLQIDYDGNFEWQKCLGGSGDETAQKIIRTMDNGYMIAGYTNSSDGDVVGHHSDDDAWIVKTDKDGNIQWQRAIGGSMQDRTYDIKQLEDGNYIMVGSTASNDGDVEGQLAAIDLWVVKLDATGEIIWQHCYCTQGTEIAYSVNLTDDGGYYVVGRTNAFEIDFTGHHGYEDIVVLRLDSKGRMKWQKCFGGKDYDNAYAAKPTVDNGLIIAGSSQSKNADVTDNKGGLDFWILKVLATGDIQWKKSFGGSDRDEAKDIVQSNDFGFVVVGMTNSSDGDVTGDADIGDAWIIKLSKDSFSTYQEDMNNGWFSVSLPEIQSRDVDLGDALIGENKDTLINKFISNTSNWPCKVSQIKITGADAQYFSVNGPLAPYIVNRRSEQHTEFRFSPTEPREYQATLEIYSQAGTLHQNIKARGVNIQIDTKTKNIDFGKHRILSRIDTSLVLIKNVSNVPVKITKIEMIGPDTEQFLFKTLTQTEPITLLPEEELNMDLRFMPIYLGRTSGRIAFHYEGIGSPALTYLFGIGNGSKLSASKDSCAPGDKISINFELENINMELFSNSAARYEGAFSLASSILYPIDKQKIFKTNEDSISVILSGNIDPSSDYIAQIPMVATLGKLDSTDINIDYMNFYDRNGEILDYDIDYAAGSFKLLGICREGGSRLINPTGKAEIKNLSPNPANNFIEFDLSLIESGRTKVSLNDLQGKEISVLFESNIIEAQTVSIRKNISSIGAGKYLLILKTPTVIQQKSIIIVK